jgi:two-component system chemotaxis response regulator CheB
LKTKILVVDNSVYMRNVISWFIKMDSSLQLVDVARNGQEAIEKARACKPDVIVMDVELPLLNGIEALKALNKEKHTRTIMLSSNTDEAKQATIAALEAGAIDFVYKARNLIDYDLHKMKNELLIKIKAAAKMERLRPQSMFRSLSKPTYTLNRGIEAEDKVEHVIAIGASTGGPLALSQLLTDLPSNFAHPILIALHMPHGFTANMAAHLDLTSALKVKEARHGDIIRKGVVYLAPGGEHMHVVKRNGQLQVLIHQDERAGLYQPSVNELFSSITKLRDIKKHYVVLSGMGDDGAKQLIQAKQQGADSVIAQDKLSCVMFEMPRAAIATGAVDYIVPLHKLADKLVELTSRVIV